MRSDRKKGFKKRMRTISLVLMIAISLFASGCWNYREIEELSSVYSFGLDKDPKSNKYLFTVEVNILEASGKDSSVRPKLFTSEGSTVMEAVSNLTETSVKQIYWSQAKVGIIGKEVAKEGIRQMVDTMLRDQGTRIDMYLVVSKEKTAYQIMRLAQENPSQMLGVALSELIDSQRYVSKAPAIHVYELANMLSNRYQASVLGTVEINSANGKKVLEVSGAALFNKGKLQGILNGDEAQYLLYAMNESKQSHIAIEGVKDDSDVKASVQLDKSRTTIKPIYNNRNLSVEVHINAEGGIEELYNPNNMDDKKVEKEVKEKCEETINENTLAVIQKVQDQYGIDVFGFSNIFIKNKPSIWKQIDDRWYDVFSHMDVKVSTYFHVTNTGEVEILSEEDG